MKKGILHFLIGVAFMFMKVIESINYEMIESYLYYKDKGGSLINGVFKYNDIEFRLYTPSYIPYILGVLFIILGIIELREVRKNAKT